MLVGRRIVRAVPHGIQIIANGLLYWLGLGSVLVGLLILAFF